MFSRLAPFALAFAVVAAVGVAAFTLLEPRVQTSGPVAVDEPVRPGWAPPIDLPPPVEGLQARPGAAGLASEQWVLETAAATGVPARALAAYAGVALWKTDQAVDCGVTWATLAAIGAVESDHGRHGGAHIGPDGRAEPEIYGVALDGDGVALLEDSDGGTLDGDSEFDRAVGPMQLIPQTWRNWHIDANLDGIEDPHNIDDAVMATANYLCRASGDMRNEQGWRQGIGAFNSSGAYVQSVADVANRLAADAGATAP